MTHQIKINVKCGHCNKSLLDPRKEIDHVASIKIRARHGNSTGYIYLSSIYGSFSKEFENLPNEDQAIYEFSCPYCNKEFDVVGLCECKAPLVAFKLKQGGRIKICTRNGCKHHSLEFEDLNDAFQVLVNNDPTGLG